MSRGEAARRPGELPYTRGAFFRGARRALPVAPGSFAFGLLFGVLAGEAGLSLVEAGLMSAIVFAGSSQLVAVGMWASPVPALAVVATTFLINLRHALMGLTLWRWYARGSTPAAYGSYFFITDESWALTVGEFEQRPADGAFLPGAGTVLFAAWVAATLIGRATGSAIPDPARFGLDFTFVAVFIALLVALRPGREDAGPLAAAAAASIAADLVLPGSWHVLVGATAGAIPAVTRGPHG